MFSTTLVLQNVLFLKERFPIFFSKLLLLSKESQLKVLESLAYLRSWIMRKISYSTHKIIWSFQFYLLFNKT